MATPSKANGSSTTEDSDVAKHPSGNQVRASCVNNPSSFVSRRSSADCQKENDNVIINSENSSRASSIQEPGQVVENGSVQSVTKRCSANSDTLSCALSVGEGQDPGQAAGGAVKMTRKANVPTLSKGSQWSKLRNVIKASGAVNQEFRKRKMNSGLHRDDSFLRKFSTRNYRARSVGSTAESDEGGANGSQQVYMYPEEMIKEESTVIKVTVIRPEGSIMFYWLALVTLAVLYNLWTCIAREAFPEIVNGRLTMWILLDVVCDIIYILDIGVQFRTGYLEQGLMVYSSRKLYERYAFSQYFIIDIISIIPLDFVQFAIGLHPMLRFPRFLKAHRLYSFIYKLESRTQYPNLFRVTNLTHILFLGAHWFAAFYFMISKAEGFHSHWSYPKPVGEYASVTRKYLMSLYWSTLTLTTIGDLPEPNTTWE